MKKLKSTVEMGWRSVSTAMLPIIAIRLFPIVFTFWAALNGQVLAQATADIRGLSASSSLTLEKADALILESANYIMKHPADPLDAIRNDAMGTVLFWMVSTPSYTFFIDETIVPVMKQDEEILAIYMVAMTQFVLENPHQANDRDEIKLQAFTKLLAYCDDPQNNIKKSKAMVEAINALRTGWLKEYLKIS